MRRVLVILSLMLLAMPLCSCQSEEENSLPPPVDRPQMTAVEVCTYVSETLNGPDPEAEYTAQQALYTGNGSWTIKVKKEWLSPLEGTHYLEYSFNERTAKLEYLGLYNSGIARHLLE